jgi:hypothetical protein
MDLLPLVRIFSSMGIAHKSVTTKIEVRPWNRLTTRGYDFGYLLKILTNEPLPANENDFFHLLNIWFPCIYDIKHVVRSVKTLRGGLQEIAESLGVRWSFPNVESYSSCSGATYWAATSSWE